MSKEIPQLSIIIRALEDIQATNITVIDVSKQTSITDYMILCDGRAARHVKAIAENIIPTLKKNGIPVLHTSGMDNGEWIIIDLGDFIIHVMQPECRDFYNLEGLWQNSSISTNEANNK